MAKWLIKSAKEIGHTHILNNIPCQDSVLTVEANGVTVMALSDGCGSAHFAQEGADITVKILCDLFTQRFDELYRMDDLDVKKLIATEITDTTRAYAEEHKDDLIQRIREHIMKFNGDPNTAAFSEDVCFDFDATVQFVAIKGKRLIVGRLGDGLICSVKNDTLIIHSMEEKPIKESGTWYPSGILKIVNDFEAMGKTEKKDAPWKEFEIIKSTEAEEYDMFLIVSDGIGKVLCAELDPDDSEEYPYVIYLRSANVAALLDGCNDFASAFEVYKQPGYDDLSIALMRKDSFKFDKELCRQYKIVGEQLEFGEPIIFELEQTHEINTPAPAAEQIDQAMEEFRLKTMGEIEEYTADESYSVFFVEQAVKIKRYLDNNDSNSLESVFASLAPDIDADDWELLLKQIVLLSIFNVDVREKRMFIKENCNA